MTSERRRLLAVGLAAVLVPAGVRPVLASTAAPPVVVWKSPTCGCCTKWVEHMEANGFKISVRDQGNAAARKNAGIPLALGSCHTALVGGYAIEGHVPAADVRRLLKDKPDAIGLAVPGMPVGSPGMEQGGRRDRYDVLLVTRDGKARIFSTHG